MEKMNKAKVLETMMVLGLVALVVFLRIHKNWLIYLAIALLVLPLISMPLSTKIAKTWFAFSHYFGFVMNYILMFFIFYLILTPLAFFQKLSGKNQILKKSGSDSYFRDRNHLFTSEDIDKPW